jgi:hypothetical protein
MLEEYHKLVKDAKNAHDPILVTVNYGGYASWIRKSELAEHAELQELPEVLADETWSALCDKVDGNGFLGEEKIMETLGEVIMKRASASTQRQFEEADSERKGYILRAWIKYFPSPSNKTSNKTPSDINGLTWDVRYSPMPHFVCIDEDCPGEECQYNILCGGCDQVLLFNRGIYCLQRQSREISVCSDCFEDLKDAMRDEGGWIVDDQKLEDMDDDYDDDTNYCDVCNKPCGNVRDDFASACLFYPCKLDHCKKHYKAHYKMHMDNHDECGCDGTDPDCERCINAKNVANKS